MKLLFRFSVAIIAQFLSHDGIAFETPTHFAISLAAATSSLDENKLRSIGKLPEVFRVRMPSSSSLDFSKDFNLVAPNCKHGTPFTAWELVACGAVFEDFYTYTRPLNHFLDPQHLDVSGNGRPLLTEKSAPEWALEDHLGDGADVSQLFSYRDANEYLWSALTYAETSDSVSGSATRSQFWGLTFQTLGQVIHLVQDMASPQHTRNEWHYDKMDLGNISLMSRYEKRALVKEVANWIQGCLLRAPQLICSYNVASQMPPVYPAFGQFFQTPRSFWESSAQTGLAQITSKSFPSPFRNFLENPPGWFLPAKDYPYPMPGQVKDVPLDQLTTNMPDAIPQFLTTACNNNLATCKMKMIGAAVADPLSAESLYNDRASSESLFDQDLKQFNQFAVVYDPLTGANYDIHTYSTPTINRFNIDRAYSILIPRAVSYSAGLINFFFRGEMSIKPPASGVYSIVDDSAFSPASPTDVSKGYRGFSAIRATVANTTPSPGGAPAQTMTNGKLWAVLKFQRNQCYTDNLDALGTSIKPLSDCLNNVDEIVVSDPVDRSGKETVVIPQPTVAKPNGEEIEFKFQQQLPINAWNVLLQIVFRGTLGSEENKVAVSTIDISEPTFFTIFNNTDYVYLGGSCYTPQQVKADPNLWKRVSSACYYPAHAEDVLNNACAYAKYGLHLQNAGSGPPLLTIANESATDGDHRIPPKHFSRFAMLIDSKSDLDLSFHFWNPTLSIPDDDKVIHVTPYHAHLSRVTPGTSTRDRFASYRGVNAWNGIGFMMDVEKMSIADDAGNSCVGGSNDLLPPLTDDARYPVPSKITLSGS